MRRITIRADFDIDLPMEHTISPVDTALTSQVSTETEQIRVHIHS